MAMDAIERICEAEKYAAELEKNAALKTEKTIETAKLKATRIIEEARASGSEYVAKSCEEAQRTAENASEQNRKLIIAELAKTEEYAKLKYGAAVSKIVEMLLSK